MWNQTICALIEKREKEEKGKKEKKYELDYTTREILQKYHQFNNRIELQNTELALLSKIEQTVKNEKDISKNDTTIYSMDVSIGKYFERECFNDKFEKLSVEDLRKHFHIQLKKTIHEYMEEETLKRELRKTVVSINKKHILKRYVSELKKNNFVYLENIFLFFSNEESDHLFEYTIHKIFHSMLLVFDKNKEGNEKEILLVLYLFSLFLNSHNLPNYLSYILDAFHIILNPKNINIPTNVKEETFRLFDHKPMMITSYAINESGRYFLFLYLQIMLFNLSEHQFCYYCDKICTLGIIGLFDQSHFINYLSIHFIQTMITQFSRSLSGFYYTLCTCLLKCLCSKYYKLKIKSLQVLIQLMQNNDSNNYRIIEMLIGYKDPHIIPIKSFYHNDYVQVNYLCILFNDRNIKVRFHFYSFVFILLYEISDSNDFAVFLLPYLFSGSLESNKIFRSLCVLFLQILAKKKQSSLENHIKDEIVYHLYPSWTYDNPITMPFPLSTFYFPSFYFNKFLTDIHFQEIQLGEKEETQETNETTEHSLLKRFICNNPYLLKVIEENRVEKITLTNNDEYQRGCKALTFTLLNAYFKYLYKQKEETTQLEKTEVGKIILLSFYFMEENITEHIPQFLLFLFKAFEHKVEEELIYVYMNCLFFIGAYVNPLNYFYFLQVHLTKANDTDNERAVLTILFFLNVLCRGSIQTYEYIKKEKNMKSPIRDEFLSVVKKIISMFFLLLKDGNRTERNLLILQVVHAFFQAECVYKRLNDRYIIFLIILLFILLKNVQSVKQQIRSRTNKIYVMKKTFLVPLDILDVPFYLQRIKNIPGFEHLHMNEEHVNIQINSDIMYEVFKLSNEDTSFSETNINLHKIILEILADDLLYNLKFVYFLIQFILKQQKCFYDSTIAHFISTISIRICNLNQRKKELTKFIFRELPGKSNEEYQNLRNINNYRRKNQKKEKNKVEPVVMEYVSILFLRYIGKYINVYEHFNVILESLQWILHIIHHIKNPYSFLFFVTYSNIATKLINVLECKEIKSILFCKYIRNDIHLNFEQFANNDGDVEHLDNITISQKIKVKKRIEEEVQSIFYYTSVCLYIIYLKGLYCLHVLITQRKVKQEKEQKNVSTGEIENLHTQEIYDDIYTMFHVIFKNLKNKLLEVLKIHDKRNLDLLEEYNVTLVHILEKKEYLESYQLREDIINASDYNILIAQTHKYFRYLNEFMKEVNLFLIQPSVFHFFFESNNSATFGFHKEPISEKVKDKSDETQNDNYSNEDRLSTFVEKMQCVLQSKEPNNTVYMLLNYPNIYDFLYDHDLVILLLKHNVYYLPFRIMENSTITLLLYCSLLFFAYSFTMKEISEIRQFVPLDNLHMGLSTKYFVKMANVYIQKFYFFWFLYFIDVLLDLKDLYKRTNYIKRLEICNSIVNTFL